MSLKIVAPNRLVSAVLVFGLCNLSVLSAQAAMLTTNQAVTQLSSSAQRQRVVNFLNRQDVQAKISGWGVSSDEAKARVASLSDDEVAAINSKMDKLPAGQELFGALIGAALLIFIILLITDLLHLTKVFNFTR